jgi:hypothetical protein
LGAVDLAGVDPCAVGQCHDQVAFTGRDFDDLDVGDADTRGARYALWPRGPGFALWARRAGDPGLPSRPRLPNGPYSTGVTFVTLRADHPGWPWRARWTWPARYTLGSDQTGFTGRAGWSGLEVGVGVDDRFFAQAFDLLGEGCDGFASFV